MTRFLSALILCSFSMLRVSAITIDEVMDAALKNDSSLADARSRLKVAEINVFKSASLYGTNLSLSGSLKGQNGSSSAPSGAGGAASGASGSDVQKSVSVGLAVPLSKWLSIGVDASTDTKTNTGTLSLSLTPCAKSDTQAETAWNTAVIDAQNAVRTTLLDVRKEYRAVLTAQAEYEYRKAAVLSAQNELSRVQYLVELGNARKSDELTVYSDLMDAQGFLDTAENNLNLAIQNLSLSTGLDISVLKDFTSLDAVAERTLVTEDEWVSRSPELANAKASLDSAKGSLDQSVTLPSLSLGTSVNDTKAWTVTAKVSFSPDLVFQKTREASNENEVMQERSYANTELSVRTAWKNQKNALVMAERNFENANRFLVSAQTTYTETELLMERGDAAKASLNTANEKLLSAKFQLRKAVESLENTRDSLDVSWQLQTQR